MANVADHSPTQTFSAWTVTTEANLFNDVAAGEIVKEFRSLAAAEKYMAREGGFLAEVTRDAWDWKPNTNQDGVDDDNVAVRGRWTGRTYTVRATATLELTYVELKVGGKLSWYSA